MTDSIHFISGLCPAIFANFARGAILIAVLFCTVPANSQGDQISEFHQAFLPLPLNPEHVDGQPIVNEYCQQRGIVLSCRVRPLDITIFDDQPMVVPADAGDALVCAVQFNRSLLKNDLASFLDVVFPQDYSGASDSERDMEKKLFRMYPSISKERAGYRLLREADAGAHHYVAARALDAAGKEIWYDYLYDICEEYKPGKWRTSFQMHFGNFVAFIGYTLSGSEITISEHDLSPSGDYIVLDGAGVDPRFGKDTKILLRAQPARSTELGNRLLKILDEIKKCMSAFPDDSVQDLTENWAELEKLASEPSIEKLRMNLPQKRTQNTIERWTSLTFANDLGLGTKTPYVVDCDKQVFLFVADYDGLSDHVPRFIAFTRVDAQTYKLRTPGENMTVLQSKGFGDQLGPALENKFGQSK